jgi:hypothetical protein
VKVIVAVPVAALTFGVVEEAGLYDKSDSLRLPKGEIRDRRCPLNDQQFEPLTDGNGSTAGAR